MTSMALSAFCSILSKAPLKMQQTTAFNVNFLGACVYSALSFIPIVPGHLLLPQ